VSRKASSPDAAQSILEDLIRQQRMLQSQGADRRLLDANKLGIIYWQGQLERKRSDRRRRS